MHLKISINNTIYALGTLSYNLRKNEASFHFHHPNLSSNTILDIRTGDMTDPIDHITWHEKVINIRTIKKILQQMPYSQGSLFPTQKTVSAMYVEGIYLNGDCSILTNNSALTWKNNCDEVLILDQPKATNFSIIFLLVPDDWLTTNVFLGTSIRFNNTEEIPLFYLRTLSHDIGRIKCFQGWDMITFTTPYVSELPILDPRVGNTYRVQNVTSPTNGLTSLLIQAQKKPLLEEKIIKDLYEMRDGPILMP